MKKFKILNLAMIILIICILYMEVRGSNEPASHHKDHVVEKIEKETRGFLFPGDEFKKEKNWKEKTEKWVMEKAVNTLPFSCAKECDSEETETDETTWSLLSKRTEGEETVKQDPAPLKDEDITQKYKKTFAEFANENFSNFDSVISHYYTVDSVTYIHPEDMELPGMLERNMKIDTDGDKPKVLIFHTHSQEAFVDSVPGDPSTTIVGMGGYLAELLNDRYKIPTMHHEGVYDLINGRLDRSEAYQMAKPAIRKILKENPSIDVVIDLHRDGVNEATRLVTEVNGKPTAKIMFFNGMCRTRTNGNLQGMSNKYLKDNLSFSMQMKMAAEMLYPGFTRKNYLKGYKYNMDFAPRMLLIEAGAQNNTMEEMRNAMEPLAQLLYLVLTQHP